MFERDPLADDAARVSALAKDITEFMAGIGLQDPAAPRLRVAYHAACSLQHGQKVTRAPKQLLTAAGFEVVEPRDAHLCCGSAGTYNLLQPEISAELKRRKVATIEATRPQVIAAGNIGCMMQIGGGSRHPGRAHGRTARLGDRRPGARRPDRSRAGRMRRPITRRLRWRFPCAALRGAPARVAGDRPLRTFASRGKSPASAMRSMTILPLRPRPPGGRLRLSLRSHSPVSFACRDLRHPVPAPS